MDQISLITAKPLWNVSARLAGHWDRRAVDRHVFQSGVNEANEDGHCDALLGHRHDEASGFIICRYLSLCQLSKLGRVVLPVTLFVTADEIVIGSVSDQNWP